MIGGGEADSLRISELIDFATTLECDGENVRRMSCVDDNGEMVGGSGTNGLNIGTAYAWSIDDGVPGSPLDGGVCLSVIMLILMRSCVRIKYKYRYNYIYIYISKTRISVSK